LFFAIFVQSPVALYFTFYFQPFQRFGRHLYFGAECNSQCAEISCSETFFPFRASKRIENFPYSLKFFVGNRKMKLRPFGYIFLKAFLMAAILLILPFSLSLTEEKPAIIKSFEQNEKLQADADTLLPLFDGMPPVPVFLKDEPIISAGTNTERGVAYTDCEARIVPSIFVKRVFYQNANRIQLVNILKHELTHAWLCRRQLMAGHDARFREKFKQVGGFGN
jgi:hypothetical protein